MRNFKVPKSMVQKTLAGMLVGESAYTTPWALHVANDRSATLDVDMSAHTQPGGTISMYVTRVGAKQWTVDLSKVPNDYVFTTSSHKSSHQVVENSEHIESVTVTLPRDVVGLASRRLRDAAGLVRGLDFPLMAARFSRAADALDAASVTQEADQGGRVATCYRVPDSPKMLRETLCVAQSRIGASDDPRRQQHIDRLSRLIAACDRHRPLGPDGKHGERHTDTCGCEDR